MKKLSIATRLALGLGTTFLAHATSFAATPATSDELAEIPVLEEIIVSAERRESNAQKTGVSVFVQTGDDLAEQGRYTLNQILEGVAGVSGLTFGGPQGAGTDTPELGISIRGVGVIQSSGGANSLPVSPTTASYVDGVYSGVGGGYDIESVEVLRGPQGTLYGRSATAGVILTRTRDPNLAEFGGDAAVELGNYSLKHVTAAVNLPILNDTLAVRASGNYYDRNGYDHPEGGAVTSRDARVKMLYKPSEDLSMLLSYAQQYNTTHTGGSRYSHVRNNLNPDDYETLTGPVAEGRNNYHQFSGELKWNLGSVTLSYLAALRKYKQDSLLYAVGPGGGLLKQTIFNPGTDTWTHELHLTSNPGSWLTWQAGAIYFKNSVTDWKNEIRWQSNNALLNLRVQDRDISSLGLFTEATAPLTSSTRLTAGLRYDKSKVETNMDFTLNANRLANLGQANVGQPEVNSFNTFGGDAGTAKYNSTSYKLRLEQDLSAANMVYGMVSSAAIPGDVQIVTSGNTPIPNKYKAESLVAYEIGSKNRFFGESLQVNADVYYYDYAGYQIVITPVPSKPDENYSQSVPAGMFGGELEVLYKPAVHHLIGFNLGYIDAKYDTAPTGSAKKEIPNIAKVTARLSYDIDFNLPDNSNLTAHVDFTHKTSYDAASVNNVIKSQYVEVKPQNVSNLNVSWNSSSKIYGVTAYVRNIFDERYRIATLLQGAPPESIDVNATTTYSDPRTYGVIARVKF